MSSHKPTDSGQGGLGHLDQVVTFFRRLPIFRETPTEIINLYAYLTRQERYAAGEVIFSQGDPSDRMFLILEGTVTILQQRHDRAFFMQELNEDSFGYFGELALLARFDWFFSARARTDVTLLTISREAFLKVQERFPDHYPQAVEKIVRLRIDRFVHQINTLIDKLPDECWQDSTTP